MCRWLAYLGEPIRLESLMYCAKDSFVGQSLRAKESTYQVNGDGCGIGWYGNGSKPGVFHTTRPAWNSGNLHHLAEQLNSQPFFGARSCHKWNSDSGIKLSPFSLQKHVVPA